MRACIRGLLALALVGASVSLAAQEPSRAEVTKRIKAATVFVQIGEHGAGSAFCVHESGLFLTNQHVVKKAGDVTLVLHPGLAQQAVVAAKVIRIDAALDLALLKVEAKPACGTLPLGSSDGLSEQSDVITAGFPFGKELALEKGEYPSISINAGKVSSLRLKKGALHRIQIDAVVNPGNSGGPVLDAKGQVVGVVVSGVRGAAVNFAIPVQHVHAFIGVPEIQVEMPSVAYADRFKPAAFDVKTLAILPAKEPFQVELILPGKDGVERSVPMKFEKNVYRAVVEPLSRLKGPAQLKTTVSYPRGSLSGWVADRAFKVGKDEVKLADVRNVRFGEAATVLLANAKILNGPLSGLDDLSLQLGSDALRLNPGKAVELTIAPPEAEDRVDYIIVVRRAGKELTRLRDTLAFRDAPAAVAKTSSDSATPSQKLDGFWVVAQTESKGKLTWPQSPEEAIYIEGDKVLWVKKDGQIPSGAFEADLEIVPGKNPQQALFSIKRGPARGQKWQVIYKIEGDLLTLASNCDADRCPSLFTVRVAPGSANFVRTYRRVSE